MDALTLPIRSGLRADRSPLVLSALAAIALMLPATAQTPQPDRHGNYPSNQATIAGQAPPPLTPGSLWQVTAPGLNCRSGAGLTHAIVRQFGQGDLLQADLGRGGSDEVLLNPRDASGNPWMRVRSPIGQHYDCYVRASQRYIQPYAGE